MVAGIVIISRSPRHLHQPIPSEEEIVDGISPPKRTNIADSDSDDPDRTTSMSASTRSAHTASLIYSSARRRSQLETLAVETDRLKDKKKHVVLDV